MKIEINKKGGVLVMVAIIIATHGKFSKEILKSSEMIFGEQKNICAIDFNPGESPDDLVIKYNNAIKELDIQDGLLFLVDLFGGSPFNSANRVAAENINMEIITGINLPMLLEIYGLRSSATLDELVEIGKNSAINGIKSLKEVNQSQLEDEEL